MRLTSNRMRFSIAQRKEYKKTTSFLHFTHIFNPDVVFSTNHITDPLTHVAIHLLHIPPGSVWNIIYISLFEFILFLFLPLGARMQIGRLVYFRLMGPFRMTRRLQQHGTDDV